MISQSDSDSTENYFFKKTEIFLIHNKFKTVPNALTGSGGRIQGLMG
jgi:hypothetical protein